jgi:hypothetical protein
MMASEHTDLDPVLRELLPQYRDTETMLKRLMSRSWHAWAAGDTETVKWLHKRILSIERAAQDREAAS